MTQPMSTSELWTALILSALCFTGLWRITTQIGVLLRSRESLKDCMSLSGLYFTAWTFRLAGSLLAIVCGLSVAGFFALPRMMWIPVGITFFCSFVLAGQGARLLGRPPPWMRTHFDPRYQGYAESLERLPTTTNAEALAHFESAQNLERHERFDGAIDAYAAALAVDPKFVKCMTTKGILHCMKGELEVVGRRLFADAAESASGSAFVYHLLARVEMQMGLFEQSKIHRRRAKENLEDERAREALPRARRNGNIEPDIFHMTP